MKGKTLAENENAIRVYMDLWDKVRADVPIGSIMAVCGREAPIGRNANSLNSTLKNIEHILRKEGVPRTLGKLIPGMVPRPNGQYLLKLQVLAYREGYRLAALPDKKL